MGLLSNRMRAKNIQLCRELLKVKPPEVPQPVEHKDYVEFLLELTGIDLRVCPVCKGAMVFEGRMEADATIRAP